MEEIQKYLKNNLIDEISRLQKSGFHKISFIIITQAIEILGSFFDSKPIRARQQSKQRFRLAIENLFPDKYKALNSNDWMYDKLRNHLTHSFLPSSWIILTKLESSGKMNHLSKLHGKTIFISEKYFDDFKYACNKLLEMLEAGEVKSKRLPPELLSDHL